MPRRRQSPAAHRLPFALLTLVAATACATPLTATSATGQLELLSRPRIIERGQNHSITAQVIARTAPSGRVHYRTNTYTTLASGLNYRDDSGAWSESQPNFELTPDGHALARRCQTKVIISPNLNDPQGVVDMQTLGGRRLRSVILGLNLFDRASGKSLQIAATKDCRGLQTANNEILFVDAFQGLKASVRFRNEIDRFHQEVLLNEKISPKQLAALGFAEETTRIEVWTEFLQSPTPVVRSALVSSETNPALRAAMAEPDTWDQALDFGELKFGRGIAFLDAQPQNSIPVFKRWVNESGRACLVEASDYAQLLPLLDALPETSTALPKAKTGSGKLLASRIPARQPNAKPAAEFQLVKATSPARNAAPVVMDYVSLSGTLTNFVCLPNQTCFIAGNVSVVQGALTLMGGSVLKFATNATITLLPQFGAVQVQTKGDQFRPIICTAKDDDSVGQGIDGSLGTPVPYDCAFHLTGADVATFSHARFRYAKQALVVESASPVLYHAQFVDCDNCLDLVSGAAWLRNCLMANTRTNFILRGAASIDAQNVTFSGSTTLAHDIYTNDNNSGVALTNCLLANVTNLASGYLSLSGDHNGFYASPQFGSNQTATNGIPFQSVGAGLAYLTEGSPFRGAGATYIDTQLLADLKLRTTYPPQIICTQSISLNTTLNPQALRGGATPDIGYTYDPIDHALCSVSVTNATLTLSPGTVIGTFGTGPYTYGLGVGGSASLVCEGSPLDRNRIVVFSTVQERADSAWKEPTYASVTDAMPGTPSQVRFRFTDWSSLAWDVPHLATSNYQPLQFLDCQFFGGQILNQGGALRATNCLFEFVDTEIDFSGGGFSVLQNNLFRGGRVSLFALDDATVVADNLFDGVTIPNWGLTGYQGGFNAYVTNAYATNEYRLEPAKTNDIILLSSPSYQTGPLGNYYQPSNSVLIDADTNTTADQVGLFHYTVCTNILDGAQIAEMNSCLDVGLHFPALDAAGNLLDSDGDLLPNLAEDPNSNGICDPGETSFNDYYNGQLPDFFLISGDHQSGMPTTFLAVPLTVLVSRSGAPLSNAPVSFTVTDGAAQIALAPDSSVSSSLSLRTSGSGMASVYVRLPSSLNATSHIAAAVTSGTNRLELVFTESTLQGTAFWGQADQVVKDASHRISEWTDQSGSGNHATQTSPGNKPLWVANAASTNPVVRFSGAQSLLLPNFLSTATQAQIFVVLKTVADPPSGWTAPWQFGNSGYACHYPGADGVIYEDFGSTARRTLVDPVAPLNQYHLFSASTKTQSWTASVNGRLIFRDFNNTVQFVAQPKLGVNTTGWGTYWFKGDMAEVLIFNHVLTEAESDSVSRYLGRKYGLAGTPATPSALVAQAISSNQVSLHWSFTPGTNSAVFSVERKSGQNGDFSEVGTVRDATSFIDTNLCGNTEYYYRVRALSYCCASGYSGEASVVTAAETAMPLSTLKLWLKADAAVGGQSVSGTVPVWLDQSGHNYDAVQGSAANRSQWIEGGVNGRPILRFSGSQFFSFPECITNCAEAEVFVVLKATTDTPSSGRALWRMGNSPYASLYPHSDGYIYEDFGSTVRRELVDPPFSLDQFHLFNIASKPGRWTAAINGALIYETNQNTVAFHAGPTLARNQNSWGDFYFTGDIAEVLMFEPVLGSAERDSVCRYLALKYGLSSAPAAPANLAAHSISTNQVSLTWGFSAAFGSTGFQIERKAAAGGAFAPVALVKDCTAWIDSGLSPATAYCYRVRAVNPEGTSSYSVEVCATTLASASALPLSDLRLWLKSDGLLGPQNANNTVSCWLDQSGEGNSAIQETHANRAQWVAAGANGRPLLRFTGGQYYRLPNFLNAATQAEVFVVVKAASDRPTVGRGLWNFGTSPYAGLYPYLDAKVYENFGSAQRFELGDPALPLDQIRLFNVASRSDLWFARLNGDSLLSTEFNQVSFNTSPLIGASYLNGSYPTLFDGDVAEILLFARVLTDAERDTVEGYLSQKYALAASAPSAPASLQVSALSGSELKLAWTASGMTRCKIERQTYPSGSFVPIGRTSGSTTSFTDVNTVPEVAYTYRVSAGNIAGDSDWANVAPPQVSITTPLAGSSAGTGVPTAVQATASDPDGSVDQVAFFAERSSLGTVASLPFAITWTNLLHASRTLSACATDNAGNTRFSRSVFLLAPFDSDGDGIDDFQEIWDFTNPAGPDPQPPPGDAIAPTIKLDEPADATPIP